jgi:protein-L-isoaspartate(D-aspartate) O-methyltransferase
MVNKRSNHKYSTLLWLLILVSLMGAAELQAGITENTSTTLPELIYESREHFSDIESANLDGLLNRIGGSRLVLLGEATHGTAEFYEMRARISRELIEKKGFNIIAVEADWPDASSIDHFISGSGQKYSQKPRFSKKPFSDFPGWMWANHSVVAFTKWLKDYNQRFNSHDNAVSFYGLDFYNMHSSMEAVLDYLHDVDPKSAEAARRHYDCLMPWAKEPSLYSRFMQSQKHRGCEYRANAVLQDLRHKRELYRQPQKQLDRHRYFNAVQNARVTKNAEQFFRTRNHPNNNSRNLRHHNLFETLLEILNYHGETSKVIIWAHNSHIGDARATDMSEHGESNLGQRVRETFGNDTYLVGFGTDHGTVAAASEWGRPVKILQVQPAHKDSYEGLFHDVKTDNFLLPLRKSNMSSPIQDVVRKKLLAVRLERAIGTSYNPEDELKIHYFNASLPNQFDEYIWFDETQAVKPLPERVK